MYSTSNWVVIRRWSGLLRRQGVLIDLFPTSNFFQLAKLYVYHTRGNIGLIKLYFRTSFFYNYIIKVRTILYVSFWPFMVSFYYSSLFNSSAYMLVFVIAVWSYCPILYCAQQRYFRIVLNFFFLDCCLWLWSSRLSSAWMRHVAIFIDLPRLFVLKFKIDVVRIDIKVDENGATFHEESPGT